MVAPPPPAGNLASVRSSPQYTLVSFTAIPMGPAMPVAIVLTMVSPKGSETTTVLLMIQYTPVELTATLRGRCWPPATSDHSPPPFAIFLTDPDSPLTVQ